MGSKRNETHKTALGTIGSGEVFCRTRTPRF
jgi:hypothetical protein